MEWPQGSQPFKRKNPRKQQKYVINVINVMLLEYKQKNRVKIHRDENNNSLLKKYKNIYDIAGIIYNKKIILIQFIIILKNKYEK